MLMNKSDLVNKIHDVLGGTKADAERAYEAFVDAIVSALKKGKEVSIPGLGKFMVTKRAARKGRNPATGEEIKLPAAKVPKFKAAKALKDAVK